MSPEAQEMAVVTLAPMKPLSGHLPRGPDGGQSCSRPYIAN